MSVSAIFAAGCGVVYRAGIKLYYKPVPISAESVTRVRHADPTRSYALATADALSRLEAVTELKTAWHPIGA